MTVHDLIRGGPNRQDDWNFARRVLIVIALVGMAYFLWTISRVVLLVFVAALIAILVNALAGLIARYTPVRGQWALLGAVLLLISLGAGFVILFGSQIAGQLGEVFDRLPGAVDQLAESLGIPDAAGFLERAVDAGTTGNVLSRMAGMGYTILGALGEVLLVVVVAIYLAADPGLYKRGAVKLLPPAQHGRILSRTGVDMH